MVAWQVSTINYFFKRNYLRLTSVSEFSSSLRDSEYWQELLLQQEMCRVIHHSDSSSSVSFQKCLAWHILIISVSAFCNMKLYWYDPSDVWSSMIWHCLFCLIISSSFCLYWITMAIISFFQPDILSVN